MKTNYMGLIVSLLFCFTVILVHGCKDISEFKEIKNNVVLESPQKDSDITNPEITFTWKVTYGATDYEIFVNGIKVGLTKGNNIKYKIEPPFKSEDYTWYVRAKNNFQYFDNSETWNFKLIGGIEIDIKNPENDTNIYEDFNISGTASDDTEIVKWTYSIDDGTETEIKNDDNFTYTIVNKEFEWKIDQSTLTVGKHKIKITIYDNLGYTATDEIEIIINPSKPVATKPDVYQCNVVLVLIWEASIGALTYEVELSTSENFEANSIVETFNNITATTFLTNKFYDTNEYYYRVRGVNGEFKGQWSDPLKFTNINMSEVERTFPTEGGSLDPDGTLTWNKIDCANEYIIEIRNSSGVLVGGTDNDSKKKVTTNSYKIIEADKLVDGTYTWKVKAIHNDPLCEGKFNETESSFVVSTCNIAVSNPTASYDEYFKVPVIEWNNTGAANYTVEVATDDNDFAGTLVTSKTTTNTSWDPTSESIYFQGDTFYVRVTEDGGTCISNPIAFKIRGIKSTASVVSPQTNCGGEASGTWALAWGGNKIFTPQKMFNGRICYYDDATLSYIGKIGTSHSAYMYYGMTQDYTNNKVYATRFPGSDSCSYNINRITVGTNLSGTPTTSTMTARTDQPTAVAYADGKLYITTLTSMACYNKIWECPAWSDCDPYGYTRFVVINASTGAHIYHDNRAVGAAGLWADSNRIYMGHNSNLYIDDATSGTYTRLFTMTLPGSTRGIIKYETSKGPYLLVTQSPNGLLFYKILNDPVNSAADLELVSNLASLEDKFWQGAYDSSGNLYFPGQNNKKIYKFNFYN